MYETAIFAVLSSGMVIALHLFFPKNRIYISHRKPQKIASQN